MVLALRRASQRVLNCCRASQRVLNCCSKHRGRRRFSVSREAENEVRNPDQISWTKRISYYTKRGQAMEALSVYKEMREQGILPNTYTFVAALKACCSIAHLEAGKEIHAHLLRTAHHPHTFVSSCLLDMYCKCGSIDEALLVFEKTLHRDVVFWTSMVVGYAHMQMGKLALELYEQMQQEGFQPDAHTFVAALKACGSLATQVEDRAVDGGLLKAKWLEQGRGIHAEVVKRGLESNMFVASSLVDMYAKCGSIVDARKVFEKMTHRDVVSWTAIILGYVQIKMGESALELCACMQEEGFKPDAHFFVAALKACASLVAQEGETVDGELLNVRCLDQGRAIHTEIVKCGLESDIFVANTLVDMYVKCGSIADACQVFEKMRHRSVVSWTTMIMGYTQTQMGELALELYMCMQHEGFIPSDRTFVAALRACSTLAAQGEGKAVDAKTLKIRCLEQGRAIHARVVKSGFESDVFVASTMIDMYAKCGSIIDAHRIFEKTKSRNVVFWTVMIQGWAEMEMGELALELYTQMQVEGITPDSQTFVAVLKACGNLAAQEGIESKFNNELLRIKCLEQGRAIHAELANIGYESDMFVANSLLNMYAKCRSMTDACCVFEKMAHQNVVSWNVMIIGYAQMETGESALKLYACMQHEGFIPDAHTFVAVLKACGSLASLKTGKEIHAQINKVGMANEFSVASCLLDMYGKSGNMADAQEFFDSLLTRNAVVWDALITGYSDKGDSQHVFSLYERMQQEGVQPVSITFLSVLTVCSYNGLVERGQMYFRAMCLEYGISPSSKHFICMVDLLGRAGQLDEAVTTLKKMPFKPDIVTWMSILGVCQKWKHVGIGKKAFECAVMLDENCSSAYTLMTNIYAFA